MTEGSTVAKLIEFALPLLLGNLFQQLYNMVDTYVIGQTGNNYAYAAVGGVGPIVNIAIGMFSGFAAGAGVVISQFFGAKDADKVRRSVHTAAALTIIMCAVFTALGVLLTPAFLHMMLRSDDNLLFEYAKQYLTIYFAGISGLLVYNMASGILRAVGDSRRPFYYLVVSSVINIVLDFLFALSFKMEANGVALATIIAQFVSAGLAVAALLRSDGWIKLDVKKIKIDGKILLKMVKIGVPTALQLALTAFSNIFVSSYICNANPRDGMTAEEAKALYLAGWTTYSKLDMLLFLPMQSISTSVMTFVGQNIGAGKKKRAYSGTVTAYLMATVSTIFFMIPLVIFAKPIAGVFNSDGAVMEIAAMLLRQMTPFYLFCCVNQVFTGSLRGSGKTTVPMVIMLATFVGIRQLYLYSVTNFISNEFRMVALSYPVGWIACCIGILTYYFITTRKREPAL